MYIHIYIYIYICSYIHIYVHIDMKTKKVYLHPRLQESTWKNTQTNTEQTNSLGSAGAWESELGGNEHNGKFTFGVCSDCYDLVPLFSFLPFSFSREF